MVNAVVLDTNIIVSAALTENGNAAKILLMVSLGVLQMYYSVEMMTEYTEVLARKKFGFSSEKQKAIVEALSETGVPVSVAGTEGLFPDASDRIFFDVARACGAFLITGNKRHFPDVPFVVTPAEFLALLE